MICWAQEGFENLGYPGSQRILLSEAKLKHEAVRPVAVQCVLPTPLSAALSLSPLSSEWG